MIEFDRICDERKLRVNVGKCGVMKFARENVNRIMKVGLNGEILEEVQSFKYIEATSTSNGEKYHEKYGNRYDSI